MNIDRFLDRRYNLKTYNCGHFVAEVYEHITGKNIDYICNAFYDDKDAFQGMIRDFQRVTEPETGCIAVMKMEGLPPHAGIVVDGRILHITHNGPMLDQINLLKLHYKISYFK